MMYRRLSAGMCVLSSRASPLRKSCATVLLSVGMTSTYETLMAGTAAETAFDRHLFACILAAGMAEAPCPLTEAVGLTRSELRELLATHFPMAVGLVEALPEGRGSDAVEEGDLRDLLLRHGSSGSREERWLAAMVARRSLRPNHLWQDLGLTSRKDLSGLLHRHFRPLAEKNLRDMKWKKFFYRQMCEAEGIMICKSPVCDLCTDFHICFGPEE